MAIEVERKTVTRRTTEQIRKRHPHIFMDSEVVKITGVPNDLPITVVGVTTAAPLTDQQKDQLEAAVEAIAGINTALVLIDDVSLAAADVPEGHRMVFQATAGFTTEPIPAE